MQSPLAPPGVATTRFAGSVSVKAIPVKDTGFTGGFVMVKLTTETPVGAIMPGLKALEIEGGTSTTTLAVAALPVMA